MSRKHGNKRHLAQTRKLMAAQPIDEQKTLSPDELANMTTIAAPIQILPVRRNSQITTLAALVLVWGLAMGLFLGWNGYKMWTSSEPERTTLVAQVQKFAIGAWNLVKYEYTRAQVAAAAKTMIDGQAAPAPINTTTATPTDTSAISTAYAVTATPTTLIITPREFGMKASRGDSVWVLWLEPAFGFPANGWSWEGFFRWVVDRNQLTNPWWLDEGQNIILPNF